MAIHLRRALRHYRSLGFEGLALPCDFATRGAADAWFWALLVPRGNAPMMVDGASGDSLGAHPLKTDQPPQAGIRRKCEDQNVPPRRRPGAVSTGKERAFSRSWLTRQSKCLSIRVTADRDGMARNEARR
jgi:hypothetical protein